MLATKAEKVASDLRVIIAIKAGKAVREGDLHLIVAIWSRRLTRTDKINMDEFYMEWLLGSGWIDFSIKWIWKCLCGTSDSRTELQAI